MLTPDIQFKNVQKNSLEKCIVLAIVNNLIKTNSKKDQWSNLFQWKNPNTSTTHNYSTIQSNDMKNSLGGL